MLKSVGALSIGIITPALAKGEVLSEPYKIDKETDSIILIAENRIYIESEAIIKIAGQLSAPWKWFQIFRFLPLKIRDRQYRWVAKNRIRWFGRRKTCRVI